MPIPNPLRILLIDDNSDDRALALRELRREFPGLQAVEITASEGLAQALTAGGFDLTITDYQLHWTDGLVILSALKSRYPDRPVVMFTGTGNEEVAVAAMKAGLDDYVIKSPQHLHRLPQAVRTALERQRLHQERERVVAALRESEERYRMLFETTPVIIYALSTEGRFIALNQAFEQLTGWSRDEWLGRSFVEMLHPDDVAFAAQQFQQVLQGAGESNYSEMRVLSRAGVILNIEIIGVQQIVNGQVSNISGFAHDITARKRAEEALGQAEQRYRSLFEEAPVMYVVTRNQDGVPIIADCNQLFLDTLGYVREDVLGHSLADFYAPASRKLLLEGGYQRALAGRFSVQERNLLASDGSIVPTLTHAVPEVGSEDVAIGTRAAFVNIAARKRAEQALEKAAAEWQTTFDATTDGIYVLDADQKILRVNRAWTQMLHIDAAEAVGQYCWQVVHGTHGPIPDCPLIRMQRSRQRERLEYIVGERWLEFVVDPIFDADRTIVGAVHIIRDITTRKRAEQSLERRAAQMALLNTIGSQIAAVLDLDRLLDQAAHLVQTSFGYHHVGIFVMDSDRDELVMQARAGQFADLFPPDHRVKPEQGLVGWAGSHGETVLANDVSQEPRYVNFYPDRIPTGAELSVPLRVEAEIVGVLDVQSPERDAFDQDDVQVMETLAAQLAAAIRNAHLYQTVQRELAERVLAEAERAKLQAQLLQAQKMEAVGILAGGVAHDFNNLLTVIQGHVDLALLKLDEAEPLYRDLRQVRQAATRAASLVRQLLLFSRRQPMEFVPLNVNQTVDELLKMLRRLIGEDIVIRTELAPDLWTVQGDAGNVEQVIVNLSTNARDAMPTGGTFTIQTSNVTMDADQVRLVPDAQLGRFVCLAVSDTGTGISPDIRAHLFEPFFTTKEMGHGTGLGLAVVYGIVKQHSGWINVYSEPRQGTTFRIYLPVSAAQPVLPARAEIPLAALQGHGERILLVEDEAGVREFAAATLRANGYEVVAVADLMHALGTFTVEQGRFHLVFTDVVLPDGTGPQLVEQLQARQPGLRVLLSSGYADCKAQGSLIQERGWPYLSKPYSLLDLLRAVREALWPGE